METEGRQWRIAEIGSLKREEAGGGQLFQHVTRELTSILDKTVQRKAQIET
jgi:hypothetical protein